ncbi:MAG: putative phosphodiesterase [Cellvibrionaceae bacterium]|jgi:predicted phosphodiesterase
MRILVLSDIHANLEAFQTVLADAAGNWDKVWFLGDLVGYGPDPNECTELLAGLDHIGLSGNHDWAVLGKLDIDSFNDHAKSAVLWARDILTDDTREFLEKLPPAIVPDKIFSMAHASPRQPVWEYILDRETASINFNHFLTPYCLVGHTHVPIIFEMAKGETFITYPEYDTPIDLSKMGRSIINPGSVGQPRDSDPRAAYALLDLEKMTWEYKRVAYDIEVTQKRMEEHGLSDRLITRLTYGW